MATISTKDYLLDQAKRRLKPTAVTIPGMGLAEKRLRKHEFKQFVLAEPPADSGLKPAMGDSGLPIIGHMIEFFRLGPEFAVEIYRKYGPIHYQYSPALASVMALGPDATQAVFSNRNKEFSQRAWDPVIGPFFDRGLMLLDFDEHMFHRRIMQEAFTRTRLSGYVEHIDSVASQVVANDWVANDPRFLFHPAAKELTLDIASVVFMGHEAGTDRDLVTTINQAFTTTTRAGNAIIRKPVKPLTWWRGIQARKTLEDYFAARVTETRGHERTDMLSVLCQAEDEDGRLNDDELVSFAVTLLGAGTETTTNLIGVGTLALLQNPDQLARLQAEPNLIDFAVE